MQFNIVTFMLFLVEKLLYNLKCLSEMVRNLIFSLDNRNFLSTSYQYGA